MRFQSFLKISLFIVLLGVFLAAGCAVPSQTTSLYIGDTADPEYQILWDAANKVTQKYFKTYKKNFKKGLIITEPRIDRDASGKETKRAFITIKQIPQGYDVKVEVPYLLYDRYENVYQDELRRGKRVLIVKRKKLKPASKTDVYMESLLRSEILKKAGTNH